VLLGSKVGCEVMFEGSQGFVAWRVMLCSIMLVEEIFLLEKGREL
jgi:hypothetical protein